MASKERMALERTADRFGLIWKSDATDEELQAFIDAKELGIDLSTYDTLAGCYGQAWDKPAEELCQKCPAEPVCFPVFARLVGRMAEEGQEGLEIAAALEVSSAAIQEAQAQADPMGAKKTQREPEVVEPEVVEPEVVEPEVVGQAPVKTVKSKKPGTRKKRPPPKKKAPPGAEPNPTRAQSVTPAAALGYPGSGLACPVEGSGDPRKVPWGLHTWKARRERERQRSKWIRMLPPGVRLNREYQGIVHYVMVRADSYLYENEGRAYPTLYSVTKRITGERRGRHGRKLCPWSAVKFWNLRKLLAMFPT